MPLTDFPNFYESTLSAPISATDLVIPINVPPSVTEGWLLLDYDVPSKREFIYFTAKTATNVSVASIVLGRGRDNTVAIAHTQNAKVRMNVNGGLLKDISALSASIVNSNNNGGWVATPANAVPSSITNLGNRSYQAVYNGVDLTPTFSPGMRIRTTRTVAAPTQSTSLNGTTQFWTIVAPNKMTFTNNFVVDVVVKLTSYGAVPLMISSRFNGTNGYHFRIGATGQAELIGFNGSSSNFSRVLSSQSIPLNKWVRITAQLDMLTFTATPTTSYVMIDSVDVPSVVDRGGTNPTALIQAGNLDIGCANSTTAPSNFFPGRIAQVAIFNAKITQAQMLTYHSQGYTGAEANLISAYSFNGVATDLMTTTPNNLTAQAGAGYVADSPFGTQASGLISPTLDYGIIMSAIFATNTTVIIQVPEGCTIPTSGGVSAVSYSSVKSPYGFPPSIDRWSLAWLGRTNIDTASAVAGYYNPNSAQFSVPTGRWRITKQFTGYINKASASNSEVRFYIGTAAITQQIVESETAFYNGFAIVGDIMQQASRTFFFTALALTPIFIQIRILANASSAGIRGDFSPTYIILENGYL